MSSSHSPKQAGPLISLEWLAILALFSISILGSFVGAGSLIRFFFPVASLLVALFLYQRAPILYLGFNWWIAFLAPFIRRLADYYRGSFDSASIMLTAPYLVTFVAGLTMVRELPYSQRRGNLPFLLAAVGILYSLLIGLARGNGSTTVIRTLLDWLPPVLLAYHTAANWRRYPEMAANTQRVFSWAALVLGGYGVYQYLVAPDWDSFWLIAVDAVSFGRPEAMGIRVWSTLNAPPPFACVMAIALLVLFIENSLLKIPAAAVGYLSFLLSLVRSAWLGWMVGLLTLITALKSGAQIRLFMTIFVLAICVLPLTAIEPFSEVISARVESFTAGGDDSSAEDRSATYKENFGIALSSLSGRGLGGTWTVNEVGRIERVALDSGILEMFFTLGWVGGLPYLGGLLLLMYSLFSDTAVNGDPFLAVCRAATLSIFSILALGPFMLGTSGMAMWGFLGLGIAGRKYYQSEKITAQRSASSPESSHLS
ncbi:MAG: O-antigen ligase domain-containing protein [Phormidesmis sp.]